MRLLDAWKWKLLHHVWLFATRWTLCPLNSPGQNTGVGSPSLLQGIFPSQGSNPGLLHCRQILCQLSQQGSPRTLEWVACPFSRGSSPPRNGTRVSYTAGGFLTSYQGSPTVDSVFLQKLPRGTCLILCLFPVHPGEQTRNPHHPHPTPPPPFTKDKTELPKQTNKIGTSLGDQWLRLHLPMQEVAAGGVGGWWFTGS